jgi:hypothetical protein
VAVMAMLGRGAILVPCCPHVGSLSLPLGVALGDIRDEQSQRLQEGAEGCHTLAGTVVVVAPSESVSGAVEGQRWPGSSGGRRDQSPKG